MKLKTVEFAHIKSFKSLNFNLEHTSVLIGQNDHGKSSILKALDIVLNQLDAETLAAGALHPDLAEKLLPIFKVNAKARRVTLNYEDGGQSKQLHITVRKDLTFVVHQAIKQNVKTTQADLEILKQIRENNEFVLIPAARDATSDGFKNLFGDMLRKHALTKMIPKKAGGTPKEYRTLKEIRDSITGTISPYIDEKLLPEIEKYFGFTNQHKLALKFGVDVQQIGEWILNNLKLGFKLKDDEEATLVLTEAGSGVQSGVLLALHRLAQAAAQSPHTQFILAIEEPEAFLHPQKQKELYQNIRASQTQNLRIIVTTHSPYIVGDTPINELGLVKKHQEYSTLHVPDIKLPRDQEIFYTYNNETNNLLLFADKVVLVEGESDEQVLKLLLQKKFGPLAHRISVISASGNQNFSPFLRMIRAWNSAKIPHLIVTDFDSLTKDTDRAILVGAKAAGYSLAGELIFHTKIDGVLEKGEAEFTGVAREASAAFKNAGLNLFVFTSDLEHSLITAANKDAAAAILTAEANNAANYGTGFDLNALKRMIGSKGIPLNPTKEPKFKRPYIHRKIAGTVDLMNAHPDIGRLLTAIEEL